MQPPTSGDIVVAHAPADASLASYYAIALRTQGAGASPYSPPGGQSPQGVAAQVRNSRALVVLVTDPAPAWAAGLLAGYRELMAAERWRRIAIVRRGAGQLSPEMQGLPWIEASDKPVEEVAAEVLSLLAATPTPAAKATGAPVRRRTATPAGPAQWPTSQPVDQPFGDGLLTRRTLLVGGLGVAALGVVALGTTAVLTRGFGLLNGAPGATTGAVVPPLAFTASGNTLYAVDLATGKLRWGFTADATVRPADSSTQGVIYAISENGTLYALKTADGKPLWQNSIPGPVKVRPVVVGGLIYTGSDDHNVYALNTRDGSVKWKHPTDDAVEARPVIANGVLYVGSNDHNVYALGAVDGSQVWKFTTGGQVYSSAAVGSDAIYIGSDDKRLWKLRISDGHERWHFTTGSHVSSSPALTSDMVYFGSQDGAVYAVPVGGASHATWRTSTGEAVYSSPVFANDTIFVGSSNHTVYALGAADGKPRWTLKTGGAVNGRFAVANGVVYANSDALYALNAADGTKAWQFAADGKTGYFSPGISQ
ncbi:MAG TPA: PQQ-binding-like beta-propeller repeat protein [Ktedonobacterales bacterium]|jgi:outer membrane protein assembly factor BamB